MLLLERCCIPHHIFDPGDGRVSLLQVQPSRAARSRPLFRCSRRRHVGPCPGKVLPGRAADRSPEDAMTLRVAAEVGFECCVAERETGVDQIDKAHQPQARTVFDQSEAQVSMELATDA